MLDMQVPGAMFFRHRKRNPGGPGLSYQTVETRGDMNSLPFSTHGQSLIIGEAKGENKNYLGQFISYFVRTMVAWKPVKVGIG